MESEERELIGQRIGSYQVLRLLGVGGMGEVYEVRHENLKRRAAIKILKQEYAQNQQIAERFLNEARIVSVIQHPGLVSVLELGHMPDGRPYMVLEFLEGESLAQRIERNRGKLAIDALRLGRQIASTLAAVHQAGVIHRDLKPDNVMIVADPEAAGGERAKLLDFGIAKIEKDGSVAARLSGNQTRTGVILGTPQYMAPEQCRGTGIVDEKADVYSLGIILYEMVTGAPPFQSAGTGELMALQMYHPPQPLNEVAPWVAAELVVLIHSMLTKAASERPTAAQVVTTLEQLGAPRAASASALLPGSALAALPSLVVRSQSQLNRPPSIGNGQVHTHATLRVNRAFRIGWVLMGVVCAAALIVGTVFALRVQPEAVAHSPPTRLVEWKIESQPSGASVVVAASGAVLGNTPFRSSRPVGAGEARLVLRLPGYAESALELSLGHNERRVATLQPLPPSKIVWLIDTRPTGATVVRTDTNKILGQTPLQIQLEPERVRVPLTIRLSKYQEHRIELDGQTSQERLVRLKKKENSYDLIVPVHPDED